MSAAVSLAIGLCLLVAGGELLVRGSVKAAERLGVSPLLIGLTLVGFGTSTPELVASVQAALAGSPGIAVGNVVGSNIANILLILGLSALITPIGVDSKALKRDGALVLATALVLVAVGHLFSLDRLVGVVFVLALAAYIAFAYVQERAAKPDGHTSAFEKAEAYEELHDPVVSPHAPAIGNGGALARNIGLAIAGLAVIILGGKLLVDGAVALARSSGISETVIGLTIVAIGTSMPEFVTSLIAAFRGHSAVALGNIMGSCIYNILGIGGVTGLISPTVIPPEIVGFDSLVMAAASLALLVFAQTGLRIGRREGAILLAGYVGYIVTLWPK